MSVRNNYREKLDFQIDNWNAEFDELEVRLRKAGIDLSADYDEQMIALRERRNKEKAKLKEIQNKAKAP